MKMGSLTRRLMSPPRGGSLVLLSFALCVGAARAQDERAGRGGGDPRGGMRPGMGREGMKRGMPPGGFARTRGEQPPAAMVLAKTAGGAGLFVVVDRKLRRLDAATLEEEKSAELPVPGLDDERQARMQEAFMKRFDRNGDGAITEDEVPRPEIIQKFDKDGDGKISIGEVPAKSIAQRVVPRGPVTMLVEGESVYVYEGGWLYRFDAETLELAAKSELVPRAARGAAPGKGRGDPDRGDRGDRPQKKRPDKWDKRDKGGVGRGDGVPDDPVRF